MKVIFGNRVRHRLTLVCGALLLPLLLAACGSANHSSSSGAQGSIASHRQPAPVRTLAVQYGTLKTTHAAAGTVAAVTESKVASQVAGVVKSVSHLAGTWVKKDEVVIQLDDSQLKLAVQAAQSGLETAQVNEEKAKAELKLAQLTLTRDKTLIKKQYIPQSKIDSDSTTAQTAAQALRAAQASISQAKAQLGQAELNLQHAAVRAPFDGQLAAVNVQPGEFVGQNAPVFVLVSPQRQIQFNVPPTDASELSPGTRVDFLLSGAAHPAMISQSPSAPINGVVPMVAKLESSDTLSYGLVGKVTYKLNLGKGEIIPVSAIQTKGNQDFVYVVSAGKATMRNVQVLSESGTDAAVSGIKTGAELILNPPPGLVEGSPVKSVGTKA